MRTEEDKNDKNVEIKEILECTYKIKYLKILIT
jgi:hypothetical protein